MGKNGHGYLGVSLSSYRYASKEGRRGMILHECGGNCNKAANMMNQVLDSSPDGEIERKARADRRFFKEFQKSKNRR
jgi:hypothetical protein